MAIIKNPQRISTTFSIDHTLLKDMGVIDVFLNIDNPVFIDPMLLPVSSHKEIKNGAAESYKKRFEKVIKYLMNSAGKGDVAWKAAKNLLSFSEISWTCLGYGGSSTRGSGFGEKLVSNTIDTAFQIIKLDIMDVDLFMGLSLFEKDIGPDRISDMTTNIIIEDLIEFSIRINSNLKLKTREYNINNKSYFLVENPYNKDPIIFVPNDIVRSLPIAADWSDIAKSLRENKALREAVNSHLGQIFANMKAAERERLKFNALKSKESFEYVINMLREVDKVPYDFEADTEGLYFWRDLIDSLIEDFPNVIKSVDIKNVHDDKDIILIVRDIVKKFQCLVEDNGLWKELWNEDFSKNRKEKAVQRLFFAVASSYCQANNIDLSPEVDQGNGPVDFKLSYGASCKVVVEIKLSNNSSLVHGYEKQLDIYKKADNTDKGVFLIVDVGSLGEKYDKVKEIRNKLISDNKSASEIFYIDGTVKESASKRK